MLQIISREAVRAAYVVNRARVYFERMQFPKIEALGINMSKGYQQYQLLSNDVEAYQDNSRVYNQYIISNIDCKLC